jgi:Flp pilus assembly protein TadG
MANTEITASRDVVTVTRHEMRVGRLPAANAGKRKVTEGGQALTEFALMLPILCLLSIGIVEIGRAAAITIAVNNGATAGAEYGSLNEAAAKNITLIEQFAIDDAKLSPPITMTATATYGCTCDNGAGTSCTYPVPGQDSCPTIDCGGGDIVECVQVNTHADYGSLFHYPGLPSTYQANGRAVMRVRR